MDTLLDTILGPIATELTAIAVTLLAGFFVVVLRTVGQYFGTAREALLRDALHRALQSGVDQAEGDDPVAQAVAHARRSTPEAIRKLGATDDVLAAIARAKAAQAAPFRAALRTAK